MSKFCVFFEKGGWECFKGHLKNHAQSYKKQKNLLRSGK